MILSETELGIYTTLCKINTQQQRTGSPTIPLTWHASRYKVHKLHHRYILCGYRFERIHVPYK